MRVKSRLGVHHMEGHIFSNLIEHGWKRLFSRSWSRADMRVNCSERALEYHLIGRTRDDAAGEAFDKVAKLLGLLPKEGSIAGGRLFQTWLNRATLKQFVFQGIRR